MSGNSLLEINISLMLILFLKKVLILIIWVYMQWFFIHMMLFIDNFNFKKGYK